MAKPHEKQRAITLRKDGSSISSIAKQLGVSKSTVSYWCRDIALSPATIQRLADESKRAGAASFLQLAEAKRAKRVADTETDLKTGAKRVGTLSKRDIFCVGLGLYWGEGYKSGSQEFGFTNSDPAMIRFYIQWLKNTFNIKPGALILRGSINELHRERITDVETFWSKQTRIPLSQFTKTSLIKTTAKKRYQNHEEHFGTLRVKVRNGTRQRREVLGALAAIQKEI